MNNDFRQRVFLPLMLPLAVVAGFIGFAFALSRVLLAVPEAASTTIALAVAAYILVIAGVVAAKPRITSRALTVGVTLALVAVLVTGVVAGAAGMRPLEEELAAEEAAEGGESGGEPVATGDGLTWVAVDIDFEQAPSTAPAGEATIVLVNDGGAPHNVTIPEISDEPIVEAAGGETAEGTTTLEPGTYEYICSVPGHEASMNGELTVE